MNTAVFPRRQAERFAQLLDTAEGAPGRHSWTRLDNELDGYLTLANQLGTISAADATPDPDFRTSLRAMLVATAEREGIGTATALTDPPIQAPVRAGRRAPHPGLDAAAGSADRPTRPTMHLGGKRARAAVIVGITTGTLALSGISMASGDAIPGDPLYGVKRSTETARLALAGSDIDRGRAYLNFARNRGVEATAVRDNPGRLDQALSDMDTETAQGVALLTTAAANRHDAAPLDLVDGFVKAQRPVVAALLPHLSGADLSHAQRSLDLLNQVGQRSADLRATLSCLPGDGRVDSLGPLPSACAGPSTADQDRPGGNRRPSDTPIRPSAGHPSASHPSAGPSGSKAPAAKPSGARSSAPAVASSPSPNPGLLGLLARLLGL